jgi:glycosyltransferase involved in cell wall biosynthesis
VSTSARQVHLVVPDGVDDPLRPSGGNTYDRRLRDGLRGLGWRVEQHEVAGTWPEPDAVARDAMSAALSRLPDGATAVVDGLLASPSPDVVARHARRLRLVVLVHLPLVASDARAEVAQAEGAALESAAAVIATGAWTRSLLLQRFSLDASRVHVAEPGVDPAGAAPGTGTGSALLCVAAFTRLKGQDLLVDALASVADLPWRCRLVGPLDREPDVTACVVDQIRSAHLDDRVDLTGPLAGDDLESAYAATDLLVVPSRTETYGLVVTEALARGVPVVATTAGGLADTLGSTPDGVRPGLPVPPDDAAALGAALRDWLSDADLRRRLRQAALERRQGLRAWRDTAAEVAGVLAGLASR